MSISVMVPEGFPKLFNSALCFTAIASDVIINIMILSHNSVSRDFVGLCDRQVHNID